MTASRVYKISVDFIGKEKHMVAAANFPNFFQLLPGKHLAYRVVRAAQQR